MGLLQFPNELLTQVAEDLTIKDMSSFHLSCRDLYTALDPFLYRRARGDAGVLYWAVKHRNTQVVKKLLEAGAHPDQYMFKDLHRRTQLPERESSEPWMTALHLAASLGYDDIIELLLDHGASVNALSQGFCSCAYRLKDEDNSTANPFWMPLHTAMCHGNDATARLLLARGASFQVAPRPIGSSSGYVTALHISCYMGALEISRLLLKSCRPHVDIRDHQGLTPLAWAYMSRQWDTIEWLVQNGANIDAHVGNGRSLLWDACYHWRLSEAYRLLELGANPRYYIGTSPLHYCCCDSSTVTDLCAPPGLTRPIDRLTLAKRLVKAGADVNAKRPLDQATPLSLAAAAGSVPVVGYLLEAGAGINSQDIRGYTPLMQACSRAVQEEDSRLPTIRLLLDRGASTTLVDTKGWTALEHFCESRKRHPDNAVIIKLLIEHGSPPNAASNPYLSLIHSFFMDNELDISKYLRTVGTRLPDKNELMEMLDHAVKRHDVDAFRFVLQFEGTTEMLRTETRLFDALYAQSYDAAEIIFDAGAGADPNCFTEYGGSPLTLAIEYGNVAIFEALMEPFCELSSGGEVEILDTIMKRGLYKPAPAAEQIRSMYFVCDQEPSSDSLALLHALLRGGADPNMRLLHPPTADYCLPLQVVMGHENHEAVELLYSYGATRLPPEALWGPLNYAVDSL
ncbi:ankyrin [Hypoxylon sp. FL0890]|nr:ankyrin [Hypoxylon sp. FL0890]